MNGTLPGIFSPALALEEVRLKEQTQKWHFQNREIPVLRHLLSRYLTGTSTYSPDSDIFNIYSSTETTICALMDELKLGNEITIGNPLGNVQIHIIDQFLQPVPVGITDELCIAGNGVGAGYLNCPELPAEKFIDNPFGKGQPYKTGDLAY